MKESKYTPGPWTASDDRDFVSTKSVPKDQSRTAAGTYGAESWEFYHGELIAESIANPHDRRLIAAAPDLFDAAINLLSDIDAELQMSGEASPSLRSIDSLVTAAHRAGCHKPFARIKNHIAHMRDLTGGVL